MNHKLSESNPLLETYLTMDPDPAFAAWALSLDKWLETPDGRRWLEEAEAMIAEQRGTSDWEGPSW